jgi:hypothetical protein
MDVPCVKETIGIAKIKKENRVCFTNVAINYFLIYKYLKKIFKNGYHI